MKEAKAVISENDNAQKDMVIYLKSHSKLKIEKQNLGLSTSMLMFFQAHNAASWHYGSLYLTLGYE